MFTFHIICINFQVLALNKLPPDLTTTSYDLLDKLKFFARLSVTIHSAIKYRARLLIHNALVQHFTITVWCFVFDINVMINILIILLQMIKATAFDIRHRYSCKVMVKSSRANTTTSCDICNNWYGYFACCCNKCMCHMHGLSTFSLQFVRS